MIEVAEGETQDKERARDRKTFHSLYVCVIERKKQKAMCRA